MTIHRRIITSATVVLALAASAAPVAATPVQAGSPIACGDVCSGHGYGAGSSRSAGTADVISPAPCGDVCSGHGYGIGSSSTVSVPPAVVHVVTASSGFDWGDAGIGAAGGLILSMAGFMISQRRTRRRAPAVAG